MFTRLCCFDKSQENGYQITISTYTSKNGLQETLQIYKGSSKKVADGVFENTLNALDGHSIWKTKTGYEM